MDFTYTGFEVGTQEQPYQTLGRGAEAVTAGGLVRVKAGASGEAVRIAKPMRIEAPGAARRSSVTMRSVCLRLRSRTIWTAAAHPIGCFTVNP